MGERRVIGLVVAALALAGCGDDDITADENSASPTVSSATTTPLVPTTASTTASPPEAVTTLAVPATTTPRTESTQSTRATDVSQLAEENLAGMTDQDIAAYGGLECATEAAWVFAAGKTFIDDAGRGPIDLDELYASGYLTQPLVLYEADGAFIRPAPSSGCLDVFAPVVCHNAFADVARARLAYLEANPGAAEPSQVELVEAGMLTDASVDVDLVGGEVVAVPGGRCEGVTYTIEWESLCRADAKTLEVAQEAFRAMNGADTTPTEADLVEAGFMRHVSGLVDLVDSAVVPKAGGPCEGIDIGV
jgi:hypothetical protein